MSLAAVSGVQWWTLGVAGAAVVASIFGSFLSARAASDAAKSAAEVAKLTAQLGQRSEHDVWQRDLRVRLYGECSSIANNLMRDLTERQKRRRRIHTTDEEDEKDEAMRLRLLELLQTLAFNASEIQTFGSLSVDEASQAMLGFLTLSVLYLDFPDPIYEIEQANEYIIQARDAIIEFQEVVRESLKIDD